MLEYLMRARRAGSCRRTLITEYAWDYHFDPGTNIVDVVINRLRKKVDSGPRAEADPHGARRGVRREGADVSTIRARLTLWYTVALLRDGARLRRRALPRASRRSSTRGSWTSALALEADLAGAAGSASRTACSAGSSPRRGIEPAARPGHQRLPRRGPRLRRRRRHRRRVARTLSEAARALHVADASSASPPRSTRSPRPERRRRRSRSAPPRPVRYVWPRRSPTPGPRSAASWWPRPLDSDRVRPSGSCSGPCWSSRPVILIGARRCWATGSPGTSLRPVERMIDELEAITDGRSLHRRLAVPHLGRRAGPARARR